MPNEGVDVGQQHRTAVAEACSAVIRDPTRSNVVRVKDLKESEPIAHVFEFSAHGNGVHVGKVLAAADWAESLGRGKYRIVAELLPQ